MNDQIDRDLGERLARAFRTRDLPAAPTTLRDALEAVPDAAVQPVARGRHAGPPGRAGSTGRALAFLGLAAVLAVGGAFALTGGGRPPNPEPVRTTTPSVPGPAVAVATFRIEWTAARPSEPATLAGVLDVVRGRLEAADGTGAIVRADGTDRVVVEMPAGLDADSLRRLVGQRGEIAFVPLGETALQAGDVIDLARFPPLFGAEAVQDAHVDTGQVGQRVVQFQLRPAEATAFGDYTAGHIGEFFAIAIDGVVVTAPRISSEIPGGNVEITTSDVQGGFGPREAQILAAFLRLGPLPVALTEVSYQPIGRDPSSSDSVASPAPSTAARDLRRVA
jgi:hypothetical protein